MFSLSILVGWPRIWSKVTSVSSIEAFWRAGRGYVRKLPQKNQFEHLGRLAADIKQKLPHKAQLEYFGGLTADMREVTSERSV